MLPFDALALTIAEADAYAASRGLASWAGSDEDKTAALHRGQDYIAGRYNGRWLVEFDETDAPVEVKYAITEAAVREFVTPYSLSPDIVAGREKILTGVKGITWQPVKLAGGVGAMVPILSSVEALLSSLVSGGGLTGGTRTIERA